MLEENGLSDPELLYEDGTVKAEVKKLRRLLPFLDEKVYEQCKKQIYSLKKGLEGERAVKSELKKLHMPKYILHGVDFGTDNCQIDFLVFTRKICFIIESKNYSGNLKIDASGNFIRINKDRENRTDSFMEQNMMHKRRMKELRLASLEGWSKFKEKQRFDSFYKTVVVLSNPKMILDSESAPQDIRDNVICLDHLASYMWNSYDKSKTYLKTDREVKSLAEFYVENCRPGSTQKKFLDTYKSYEEHRITNKETHIYRDFIEYRERKMRGTSMKTYHIYDDEQLDELLRVLPETKEELINVHGFGEKKVEKYGEDIIRLIKKYLDS